MVHSLDVEVLKKFSAVKGCRARCSNLININILLNDELQCYSFPEVGVARE